MLFPRLVYLPASSLVPFDPVADPVSVDPAETGVAGGEAKGPPA